MLQNPNFVTATGALLNLIISIFVFILVLRIVTEMIQSFSRNFRPPRWFALVMEPIFLITDPPVKLLRKLIPPVRMGNAMMDVSVLVLFIICMLLQMLIPVIFR